MQPPITPASVAEQLNAAADSLERLYLVAGVRSPYFDLALRIDRVVRELADLPADFANVSVSPKFRSTALPTSR